MFASFVHPSVKPIKSWNTIVDVFFGLNEDEEMKELLALAKTFAFCNFPNHLSIYADSVNDYFGVSLTAKSIQNMGITESEFVQDQYGLRFTFPALRRLIMTHAADETIEQFDMLERFYQIYIKYAMNVANKRATHWFLIERINSFTKTMQPHEVDGEKIAPMDEQPKVYSIISGPYGLVSKAMLRYSRLRQEAYENDKGKTVEASKYAPEALTPIFSSMCDDINDELDAIKGFIHERYVLPYCAKQMKQNKAGSIKDAKICVKSMKSVIMIDESQKQYDTEKLLSDIKTVRAMLQHGMPTHKPKTTKPKKAISFEKWEGYDHKCIGDDFASYPNDIDDLFNVEAPEVDEAEDIVLPKSVRKAVAKKPVAKKVAQEKDDLPEEIDEDEEKEEEQEEQEEENNDDGYESEEVAPPPKKKPVAKKAAAKKAAAKKPVAKKAAKKPVKK